VECSGLPIRYDRVILPSPLLLLLNFFPSSPALDNFKNDGFHPLGF